MTALTHKGRVRVWQTHTAGSPYPEDDHVDVTPLTGVCFSGGSTRSYAATIGQLRGLTQLGLIPRIAYISAVSGGAWAAAAYTYTGRAGEDDTEILGPVVGPQTMAFDRLTALEPHALGYAATRSFGRILRETHGDQSVRPADVWSHAIGRTFLEPYGLFDPHTPVGFTLDRATYDAYLTRNPAVKGAVPHVVHRRSGRPYLTVHAALNWPADAGDASHKVGFEMSPLAVGTPQLLTLRSGNGEPHRVGGGFVETLGFGCGAPSTPLDDHGLVSAPLPSRPLTLADAIGASSAFRAAERDLSHYPHMSCWPVTGGVDEVTSMEVLTDGGDVENYGIIPLLRRRVTAIVVFINTLWPLDLDYDPATWPVTDDAHGRVIDPFLAPLFGGPDQRFPHNRVFAEHEFSDVVSTLQTEKRAGRPLVAMTTHTVHANDWWGVVGGWDVRVCWVYNDRVSTWEDQLDPELRGVINAGHQPVPEGPVAHFPHFLTRGQNPGQLIELTPMQVNLLSHLACWTVTSNAARLDTFLR